VEDVSNLLGNKTHRSLACLQILRNLESTMNIEAMAVEKCVDIDMHEVAEQQRLPV
jgi:hypothetical protein